MLDIEPLEDSRPVQSICDCKIYRPFLIMSKPVSLVPDYLAEAFGMPAITMLIQFVRPVPHAAAKIHAIS
ncbi:hypothetical protein GGE65_001582 [Skermanella aerolata]|uniref:hypothetical protein n=1 Tax=Skermanella aerolata TaxID=393310 RepID=UPI003D221591